VTEISFPPPRDLPSGHIAARKQHLLSEIAREQGKPRLWVPRIPWLQGQRRWRPIVVIALALLAFAIAAVAIAGPSLFGFSNHGHRAHANSSVKAYLEGQVFKKLGLPTPEAAKPNTLRRLAFRQGIWVYSARKVKDNSLCFYMGLHWRRQAQAPNVGSQWRKPGQPPGRFQLERGPECSRGPNGGEFALPAGSNFGYGRKAGARAHAWLRAHPFPSPARPILDLSMVGAVHHKQPGCSWCSRVVWPDFGILAGVAADGVRSVQVLSLSDCKPVVTVPVRDNVYIDAQPPQVAAAFLVARDVSGKIIWHSWQLENRYAHVPLQRKAAPRHCGFEKWEWTR
jgi:hypothetical protein